MTKEKIVSLFFDGTGNGPNDENPSNVFKLYKLFSALEGELFPYPIYMQGPGASEYDVFVGQLFGSGIWDNIKKSYRELTLVFNENPDMKLVLFGFSRGAYSVHLFIWLLYLCGIPEDVAFCDEVVDHFIENPDMPSVDNYKRKNISSIEFVGVWDIVKSVIPNNIYHDKKLPPIVKQAYHAMALDEVREKFPVMLWDENGETKLQQIWFAGVHSEVGGGYATRGLSDIAFKWIYDAVQENELPCDSVSPSYFQENCTQALNNPFKDEPLWLALGMDPRTYNGENTHPSVKVRHTLIDYTPAVKKWTWA